MVASLLVPIALQQHPEPSARPGPVPGLCCQWGPSAGDPAPAGLCRSTTKGLPVGSQAQSTNPIFQPSGPSVEQAGRSLASWLLAEGSSREKPGQGVLHTASIAAQGPFHIRNGSRPPAPLGAGAGRRRGCPPLPALLSPGTLFAEHADSFQSLPFGTRSCRYCRLACTKGRFWLKAQH